jgi:hypothetical protein
MAIPVQKKCLASGRKEHVFSSRSQVASINERICHSFRRFDKKKVNNNRLVVKKALIMPVFIYPAFAD